MPVTTTQKNGHGFFEYLCFFIISFLIICPTVGVMITGRSFYPFFNYYMFTFSLKSPITTYSVRGIFSDGNHYDLPYIYLYPISHGIVEKVESLLKRPDAFVRIQKSLRYFKKNYEKYNKGETFVRMELVMKTFEKTQLTNANFRDRLTFIQEKLITYVDF